MRRRAKLEGEVPKARRSRPQGPARGKVESNEDLDHVLRRKEVEELLHVHRRTIDYYLDNGYLQRVYGNAPESEARREGAEGTAKLPARARAESARSGSPARACSSSCSGASPDRWGSDFHKCEAHVRIVLAVVRKLSRTDIRKFGTMSAFLKRNRPAGWCEGPPKGGEIPANLFFVMAHCFRRTDFVHCKHLDRKVGMFETRSKFFA